MIIPQFLEEMLAEQQLRQQFSKFVGADKAIVVTSTPDIAILNTLDITIEDVP